MRKSTKVCLQGIQLPPRKHPKITKEHLLKVLKERKEITTLVLEGGTFIETTCKTKKACSLCHTENKKTWRHEVVVYQNNGNKYPNIILCSKCLNKYQKGD